MDRNSKQAETLLAAVEKGYWIDDRGYAYGPRGHRLSLTVNTRKYPTGGLKRFGVRYMEKKREVYVHQLQAYQLYGDAIFDAESIYHKDSNTLNNGSKNICIGSRAECFHNLPQKRKKQFRKLGATAAIKHDWPAIEADRENGMTYAQLLEKHGVSCGTLSYHFNSSQRKR